MIPLLIRVINTQTGETEHSAYAGSPVRIGRNRLNELVINEPFVSQWHAVIRFDAHRVTYVDLGSTNGTVMNGHRLAKHVQIEAPPNCDLRIGPLQLQIIRSHASPEMFNTSQNRMFALEQPSPQPKVSAATMMFNVHDAPMQANQNTIMFMAPGDYANDVGAEPTAAGLGYDMQRLMQVVEQTKPSYEVYRRSWQNLLHQLQQNLRQVEAEQREGLVVFLCQQFPQLAREPEFRSLVKELGVNQAALGTVDADEFIKRLSGYEKLPVGAQINTAVAMERVGALLESFAQSFIELRKGYEQFGEEMAVQLTQESSGLQRAESTEELLRYLLDWTVDGGGRVRELTRAFADLAMHQVAVLSGVMSGVRGMLNGISPMQLSGSKNAALARAGGGGFFEKIFNTRKSQLWQKFATVHQSLVDEDRFSREVFGRNFARAYYMVSGGQAQETTTSSAAIPAARAPHAPPYQ